MMASSPTAGRRKEVWADLDVVKDVVAQQTQEEKEARRVEEMSSRNLPISSMETSRGGRLEKKIFVFRVKDLPKHELVKWICKKNEQLVGSVIEQRFEETHAKLLYLLSFYGVIARSATDLESWMRQIPFNVLTFEAILKGVVDLDYAPLSIVVVADGKVRRIWMNVSQEGQSMIDDLRECGHINGLKVQTKEFTNQTMFQVSELGLKMIEHIPIDWKLQVDRFLFLFPLHIPCPEGGEPMIFAKDPEAMIEIRFNGKDFVVYNKKGFQKTSHITQTEDVSYCSSPYLPTCLLLKPIPFKNNAYRANECAQGESAVEDELDEIMALDNCMTMVVEYIPFGTNQLVGLNERLGALDRCQGGFFTNTQDTKPTDTKFQLPAGMTDVRILDFNFTNHINFEAHISFPETGGIVQVEEFGMHLHVDGTVLYGLKVEAIDDRKGDNISIDKLSRMLVDIHQDSTKIMGDMLTPYQRSLMDIVFQGDTENRGKYNVVIANEIKPANNQKPSFDYLVAQNFIDRGEVENELRQVIGEIESSTIINKRNVLVIGRGGTLFAGPDAHRFEDTMVLFARLLVREKFLGYFFSRTFNVDNVIEEIGKKVAGYHEDPRNIQTGRELINQTSRVVILLRELLNYIDDSLVQIGNTFFNADEEAPRDRASLELAKCLGNVLRLRTLKHRCRDLKKLLTGIDHNINILQSQMITVSRLQTEMVVRSIDSNFKCLVGACAAQERSAISSKVMETIFSTGFAMKLIDRICGGEITGNTGPSGLYPWIDDYLYPIFMENYPGLFWGIVMTFTISLLFGLQKFMQYLLGQAMDARSVVFTINRRVDAEKLEILTRLTTPSYVDHSIECCTPYSPGRHLVKVGICKYLPEDKKYWPGEPPRMILTYNQSISFLLSARLDWNNQRLSVTDEEINRLFHGWLYEHGVYEERWWEVVDQGPDGNSTTVLTEEEEAAVAIDFYKQESMEGADKEKKQQARRYSQQQQDLLASLRAPTTKVIPID